MKEPLNQRPGLWVQLSPEMQAKSVAAWKAHMTKPPEQRWREYCETILRGLELFRTVVGKMIQDANVKTAQEIINTQAMTTTTDLGNGWVQHHYIGYSPTKEDMMGLGWTFYTMGAEGPYYDMYEYRLQIVQQGPGNQSVINLNSGIEGYQNCCIWKNGKRIFFGYVHSLEDIRITCLELGIK